MADKLKNLKEIKSEIVILKKSLMNLKFKNQQVNLKKLLK
jgi:ribosomal protein L29